MMKKLLLRVVLMLLACGLYTAPTFANVSLYDWSVNIDGVLSELGLGGDPVPAGMNVSGFDNLTGLGTITVTVSGPGSHFVGLFVDHEIDEAINTYFNETGATSGTPAAGQSWEIDEPGFVFGDIYTHFAASTLDNFNAVPVGSPEDVSMALGWEFSVASGFPGIVEFNLSDVAPLGGFYLMQNDPDSGGSVYFSSDFSVVPLPGAFILVVLGLGPAGSLVGRFQRRRTQK